MRITLLLLVALILATTPARAGGDTLELSRRVAGAGSGDRGHVVRLSWSTLQLQETARDDVQVGARRTYRGVPLRMLLERAPRTPAEDTALLRFANGMVVPVPLEDATLQRMDVFVAREVADAETGRFSNVFPPVVHTRGAWITQRAIEFSNNKVVISTPWHPALGPTTQRFSPWLHVDSLVAIELVNGAAWDAQFAADEAPRVMQGLGTFRARCQFCHGVRGVGASFGWDFVVPLPVHTYRTPESLLVHVKHSKLTAAERGLMMPPQPDAELDEMQALWEWMRSVSARPLRPYAPLPPQKP